MLVVYRGPDDYIWRAGLHVAWTLTKLTWSAWYSWRRWWLSILWPLFLLVQLVPHGSWLFGWIWWFGRWPHNDLVVIPFGVPYIGGESGYDLVWCLLNVRLSWLISLVCLIHFWFCRWRSSIGCQEVLRGNPAIAFDCWWESFLFFYLWCLSCWCKFWCLGSAKTCSVLDGWKMLKGWWMVVEMVVMWWKGRQVVER